MILVYPILLVFPDNSSDYDEKIKSAIKFDSFYFVGVEIIIKMDGIQIVSVYHICNYAYSVFYCFRFSRIEIKLCPVFFKNFRFFKIKVIWIQLLTVIGCHAVGVAPGMKFHPSFVRLDNHKLKRIPDRIRSFSLLSGEKPAPWL